MTSPRVNTVEVKVQLKTQLNLQKSLSSKQAEVPTPITKPTKPLVVDLEGEWENFNKLINTKEQSAKPLANLRETAIEMVVEGAINTQETKHILVAMLSEIVLKIEEIPPLNYFIARNIRLLSGGKERNEK